MSTGPIFGAGLSAVLAAVGGLRLRVRGGALTPCSHPTAARGARGDSTSSPRSVRRVAPRFHGCGGQPASARPCGEVTRASDAAARSINGDGESRPNQATAVNAPVASWFQSSSSTFRTFTTPWPEAACDSRWPALPTGSPVRGRRQGRLALVRRGPPLLRANAAWVATELAAMRSVCCRFILIVSCSTRAGGPAFRLPDGGNLARTHWSASICAHLQDPCEDFDHNRAPVVRACLDTPPPIVRH